MFSSLHTTPRPVQAAPRLHQSEPRHTQDSTNQNQDFPKTPPIRIKTSQDSTNQNKELRETHTNGIHNETFKLPLTRTRKSLDLKALFPASFVLSINLYCLIKIRYSALSGSCLAASCSLRQPGDTGMIKQNIARNQHRLNTHTRQEIFPI